MSGPVIALDPRQVSLQPGDQARVVVTVTNPSAVVERYDFHALGPAAPWTRIDPPAVSVYPKESVTAELVLSPPGGTVVAAGVYPMGVIARSALDQKSTAVAEGSVELATRLALQAKIVPVTSTGRRRGLHTVQITNSGNAVSHLHISASDPDELLDFHLSDALVIVPPGEQATLRLTATPKRLFLRGSEVRLPFEAVVEPLSAPQVQTQGDPGYGGAPSRLGLAGAFRQKPLLPAWLVTLLVALALALVAAGVFHVTTDVKGVPLLRERGDLPRPLLRIAATSPGSVQLSWDQVNLADEYHLQPVYADGQFGEPETLNGEATVEQVVELPPSTEVCFRLRAAQKGTVHGQWSATVCATTMAAPGTPTPTPPPTPTPSSSPSSPTTTASGALTAMRGTPTLDGSNDEWGGARYLKAIHVVYGTTETFSDVNLMWDDDALYLFAAVRDADVRPVVDSDRIWQGDSVNLELGPDARDLPAASGLRDDDAYYSIGLTSSATQPTPRVSPQPSTAAASDDSTTIAIHQPNAARKAFDNTRDSSRVSAVAVRSSSGYRVEARIPWETTGLSGIEPNAVLAANLCVSDRMPAASGRLLAMVCTNEVRNQEHPHTWQQLVLLG